MDPYVYCKISNNFINIWFWPHWVLVLPPLYKCLVSIYIYTKTYLASSVIHLNAETNFPWFSNSSNKSVESLYIWNKPSFDHLAHHLFSRFQESLEQTLLFCYSCSPECSLNHNNLTYISLKIKHVSLLWCLQTPYLHHHLPHRQSDSAESSSSVSTKLGDAWWRYCRIIWTYVCPLDSK